MKHHGVTSDDQHMNRLECVAPGNQTWRHHNLAWLCVESLVRRAAARARYRMLSRAGTVKVGRARPLAGAWASQVHDTVYGRLGEAALFPPS